MKTNNLFSFRHLLLTLLVVAQYGLQAQAVISCIGGTGNVSTGISDSPGNPYLGISTPDPYWKITSRPSGSVPIRAIVCPSFLPFWCSTPIALTNAGWINETNSFSGHTPGNYVFEREFTVPTGTGILDLNFGIAFDDTLVSLSLVPPSGSPIPLTVVSNPPPNYYCIGSFPTPRNIQCPVAGIWKIRAEINYIDSQGGFMLSGNIRCQDAACPPAPCKAEITNIVCGPLVNGQQTYLVSGIIDNSSTSAATLDITVGGVSVSSISPATVPANSTGNSFSFTYTAPSGPPVSPCFNITLSSGVRPRIVLCESRICRALPICCKAEITNIVCRSIVNGQQTYLVSGTITNGSTSAATLGITVAPGSGVVISGSISPATIPASSIPVPFSFTYTAGTLAPCFDITLSGGTPSRILCQSRICRELPICPDNCCPVVKVVYSTCHPLPIKHGTFTVSGPKCLSSMTITWTAPALNPAGDITYNNPGAMLVSPWGGPGTFTYSSFGSTNVTNLQFVLSSALAATGTVTVSFVLCDGTKCTQTFPWTSKSTGNPIELAQTRAETGKIFLASFNLKSGAVDGKRPKFVAFGFSNRDEIATFKPVILAVTGARHPADPYDQKIMSLEKASNSALNAVFELDETTPYTDRLLNVVYRADKPDLQLAYVIYDAEGNPLGASGIKLAAALLTTDTKEVRVAPNEQMVLFPNPADHYLQVNYTTDASHPVLLEVFDLLGRSAGIVQRSQAGKGENQYTLDTANLPGGSYLLKISSNNGVLTQAFQIVR